MKINFRKMFLLSLIVIILVGIIRYTMFTAILGQENRYERPNYDYVATIYHSEMQGIDAGTDYTYYIYPSANPDDYAYFYIKSTSYITIAGPSEETDIGSGSLENKTDLTKIKEDIRRDSQNKSTRHVSYSYYYDGEHERCNNIKELANKLFP